MIYDLIIIGGGPAGLFSAICADSNSAGNILIIEKKVSCGLKLLVTGTSQCNITNSIDINLFSSKYGKNGKFLKNAFKLFDNMKLIEFFNKNKIFFTKTGNKFFPTSRKASDILNVMLNLINKSPNIELVCNSKVIDITKNDFFEIKSENNFFKSKHLIIATGGKSYPKTGSEGDGYFFAQKLGHSIINPEPALCGVILSENPFSDLSGISLNNTTISVYRNNKKIAENNEDVLFTHKGVSGPSILHLTRYIQKEDILKFNFCNKTFENLNNDFVNTVKFDGKQTVNTYLKCFNLPERLTQLILSLCKVQKNLKLSELNKEQRKLICKNLTEFNVSVKFKEGFEKAMVTAGGVDLKEINPSTMESRIIKSLFFAGEVIDIDGDSGGFNLQACFSTAFLAAKLSNLKCR